MNIRTERTSNTDGDLIFTITISHPVNSIFHGNENEVFELLDLVKESLELLPIEPNSTKNVICNSIEEAKQKSFNEIINRSKCLIKNEFNNKLEMIYQEIYNWTCLHQDGKTKKLLNRFNQQVEKYYFDNDDSLKRFNQASDYEIEIDDQEEDDAREMEV